MIEKNDQGGAERSKTPNARAMLRRTIGGMNMADIEPRSSMTTGEAEAWRAGWRAALAAIPMAPPQEWRRKVWKNLKDNAEAGNLRADRVEGNGYPDLMWRWVTVEVAAMEPPA